MLAIAHWSLDFKPLKTLFGPCALPVAQPLGPTLEALFTVWVFAQQPSNTLPQILRYGVENILQRALGAVGALYEEGLLTQCNYERIRALGVHGL